MLRLLNRSALQRRNIASAAAAVHPAAGHTPFPAVDARGLPLTQMSTLPNGLTVASEIIPNVSTATVGIWIDAGSRADTTANSGTAHFLEHLSFKGTKKRSQLELELEIENIGAHLNAYTSRENTVYYAKSTEQDISSAVDILSDILTKSVLDPKAVERERDVIIRESEEVDKMHDEVVFDHLHAICYKGQPLGRTILGPIQNIKTIKRQDLTNYIDTNYSADRMVLVGAGSVKHEQLIELAEKHFGHLPSSEVRLPLGSPRGDIPVFCGGELRIQDNSMPTTHVAIAIEGVSWNAPDYFTALVAQSIVGNWDRALGTGLNSPSAFASNVSGGISGDGSEPLANSYMSFSTSYSDSGLWGIYITADKETDLTYVFAEIAKEWNRLKQGGFSQDEVDRAKAQLKASLLLGLDGSTPIAEDIGRQVVTTGKRLSPEEVFKKVDIITKDDVINWANYRMKSKPIAMSAKGNVSTIPPLEHFSAEVAK